MKTLYESILDDEDTLIDKAKENSEYANPFLNLYRICKETDRLPAYLEHDKEFSKTLKSIELPKDMTITLTNITHPETIYFDRITGKTMGLYTPKTTLFTVEFPEYEKYRVELYVCTNLGRRDQDEIWGKDIRRKFMNKFSKEYGFKKHPRWKENFFEVWILK